jgi:hypothetical protein
MAAGTDAMPSNLAFIKRDLGRVKPPLGGFLFRVFLTLFSRRGVMHFQRPYLVHCIPAEQEFILKK